MDIPELTPAGFTSGLAHMEKALGWPTGTLVCLADETDWSFVIRGSAMVEACLSSMLTRHEPRLSTVFENLSTGHSKTGKVAVAHALELIDAHQKKFIATLLDLRNKCAHDVGHFDFSIDRHVSSLSTDKRAEFFAALEWGAPSDELPKWRRSFVERPKLGLLSGILRFISWAEVLQSFRTADLKLTKEMETAIDKALTLVMHAGAETRWPS